MITNDADFKQALDELEVAQQRRVGAAFVRNVLALNPVVAKVVDAAANEDTTADELAVAFKQAKAAALDSLPVAVRIAIGKHRQVISSPAPLPR
jgi:hypothetical protein